MLWLPTKAGAGGNGLLLPVLAGMGDWFHAPFDFVDYI
jgi:hypothetical protein